MGFSMVAHTYMLFDFGRINEPLLAYLPPL